LSGFDLAILNENLGDLPALVTQQGKKNNSDKILPVFWKD